MASANTQHDTSPTREDFESLVKKANGGNKAALVELRRVLDDNPHIWRTVGNLGLHARMALARTVAGGDELVYDSLMRYAYELETEFARLVTDHVWNGSRFSVSSLAGWRPTMLH